MRWNKNPPAWELSQFRGPRGSTFSDIDAVMHLRGSKDRFLIVEGKREGEEMLFGQRYLLEGLSRLPDVTVIIVEGTPPNEVTSYQVVVDTVRVRPTLPFEEFFKIWRRE